MRQGVEPFSRDRTERSFPVNNLRRILRAWGCLDERRRRAHQRPKLYPIDPP